MHAGPMVQALRPYQERFITDLFGALKTSPAVVGQMATGAGKTHALVAGIQRYLIDRPGARCAWVSDLQEINADTLGRFRAAGLRTGQVWAGASTTDPDAQVQVCQLQTITRRSVSPVDLIVWDEAHGIEAAESQRLLSTWQRQHLVGITATPSRGDGVGLGHTFGELIQGPQTKWLQRHGWCAACGEVAADHLCPANQVAARYLVPCEVMSPASGPLERGLAADPVVVYRQAAREANRLLRAIVFCADGQAEVTAARFNAAGIPSETVLGDTPKDVRAGVRDRVTAAVTRVLCVVDCFVKGYDLPALDTLILARRVTVHGVFLQIVGRVLRPWGDKQVARIYDLTGSVYLHGLPDEDRRWSLDSAYPVVRSAVMAFSRCAACLWLGPVTKRCGRCGERIVGRPIKPPAVRREERLVRIATTDPASLISQELAKLRAVGMNRLRMTAPRAQAWAQRQVAAWVARQGRDELTAAWAARRSA